MESKKEQWMNDRCGSFTASQIHALFTEPKTKSAQKMGLLSESAMTYIKSRAAELLTGTTPETFTSKEMQWGIDNEPYAAKLIQEKYGNLVYFGGENPKFFSLTDFSGASPDGYYNTTLGEIKCPNSSTHIDYLMMAKDSDPSASLKDYNKAYWHQLQMGGVCLKHHGVEITHCSLVSYDPRFKRDFQLAEITFPIDAGYEEILRKKISKAENQLRQILDLIGV